MKERHFYHICFPEGIENVHENQIEEVFNKALNWYKYSKNCWILYSSSDAKIWYKRLLNIIGKQKVLIVKLDLNDRQGYMGSNFWDWLRAREEESKKIELPKKEESITE